MYYLGMDFGTSGARAIVINNDEKEILKLKEPYPKVNYTDFQSKSWQMALDELLLRIPDEIKRNLLAITIDATSSTTLLINEETGEIVIKPEMYNDIQEERAIERTKKIAPEGHLTRAPSSTLCKVVKWDINNIFTNFKDLNLRVLHQSDWLASLLHNDYETTDYNNALKLGYDPELASYPKWLQAQSFYKYLPIKIMAPGDFVSIISEDASSKYNINPKCHITAGTTDSIAAVMASGIKEQGEAVTSLGSTIALKMISDKRIDNETYGIYSHKLGELWLSGGASNSGGIVLRQFFTDEELVDLSKDINPEIRTNLNYYPLPVIGERFPVNNIKMESKIFPRPKEDYLFLQGLLEGMAEIEREGYALLEEFGCGKLKRVVTTGAGSLNEKWTQIRTNLLGVPVTNSKNNEAAYGSALLAKRCIENTIKI